jgi:hypothetical protein
MNRRFRITFYYYYYFIFVTFLTLSNSNAQVRSYYDNDLSKEVNTDTPLRANQQYEIKSSNYLNDFSVSESNKDFWDIMYHNSMNLKTKFTRMNGEKVCFTCPIDRSAYTELYKNAMERADDEQREARSPDRTSINWSTKLSNNIDILLCRNNSKQQRSSLVSGELDYTCENDRLCLIGVTYTYPRAYQCYVKSYAFKVQLEVVGE